MRTAQPVAPNSYRITARGRALWPVLLSMCYVARTPVRAVLGLLLIGAVALVLGYWVMHDYQRTRIDVWWQHFGWQPEVEPGSDPEARAAYGQMRDLLRTSAYQPWQSLIAIGSGGWTGFGIGQGPQNVHDFLPYRESDYVFAVVAEETGLLGSLAILGLELALALRILWIAARSRERFGRLLCVGIAAYLAAQSLLHVAVCVWIVPAKGVPMPLLSYGGSSILANFMMIGLLLRISAESPTEVVSHG